MRVRVDREKCQGHNRCYMACPEVYKVDDETYAYVEDEEVPEALKDQARRGAEVCPEHAITVTG
ncbi:MAG: ferredoxin [Chloroflexi bacterium]|nr:ferredoxin [Chloroflexota bacterium]